MAGHSRSKNGVASLAPMSRHPRLTAPCEKARGADSRWPVHAVGVLGNTLSGFPIEK